jgi:hypothetical protein
VAHPASLHKTPPSSPERIRLPLNRQHQVVSVVIFHQTANYAALTMGWHHRHPCPRHHDEHSGQDKKTGQEQGQTSHVKDDEVRALYVPYRADNHGLSRLITVSQNRCSAALSCACHVVPKL